MKEINEIFDTLILEDGTEVQTLKAGVDWEQHLSPKEKEFYDRLNTRDKLIVAMACNPINAIRMGMKKNEGKSALPR